MKKGQYYSNRFNESQMSNINGRCGIITKVLKDGKFYVKGSYQGKHLSVLIDPAREVEMLHGICKEL